MMEREILFRGKNKYNGKWEVGDLRHIWVFDEPEPRLSIVDNSNKMNNAVSGVEVIPETVGRFTGLTDKSGRKIFEGDIIADFDLGNKYIVEYDDRMMCFSFINVKNKRDKYFGADILDFWNWYDNEFEIDVVGNIYDNANLSENERDE